MDFAFIKQNTRLGVFVDVPDYTHHSHGFDTGHIDSFHIGRTYLFEIMGQTRPSNFVKDWVNFFTKFISLFERGRLEFDESTYQDFDP
jgi:hypothetical protein